MPICSNQVRSMHILTNFEKGWTIIPSSAWGGSGALGDIRFDSAVSLSGDTQGLKIDLNTNVTPGAHAVSGLDIKVPSGQAGVWLKGDSAIGFGDTKNVMQYWDGTNLVFNPLVGETVAINFIAGQTTFYGGNSANADLVIRANASDGYPKVIYNGGEAIQTTVGDGKDYQLIEVGALFTVFNRSASYYKTDCATGSAMKFWWDTKTTTGNVVLLELDAFTNLTMGANLGVTSLKLRAIAPNGVGVSYLLDGYDNANAQVFYVLENGSIGTEGRILGAQGADIASANDITLGNDGNYFDITGAVQIETISATGWTAGAIIVLQFDANPVVKHNTAGAGAVLLLSGAGDFNATAGDTLTLVYDGTAWREVSRTVI